MGQQRLHVPRIELAGVHGDRAREVRQPDDRHPGGRPPRRASSARRCRPPPRPSRRSPTVAHRLDRRAGNQLRRRPAGHEGRRDHDVEVRNPALELFLLPPLVLLGQLLRVAAGGLLRRPRGRGSRRRGSRPALHHRPHVEAGDDGSEPALPSQSPAAPRRRRRARAPSPAEPSRRRSSASGRTAAAARRRAGPPCTRRRSPARTAHPSAGPA